MRISEKTRIKIGATITTVKEVRNLWKSVLKYNRVIIDKKNKIAFIIENKTNEPYYQFKLV